ncbi:MAG: DUF4339 domain-containing protein [Paludibacteraceae bacterium]|nr:DUF4339 domain-containing protein [Paludibacteraceae bacterium]MBQ3929763.1 DUF4339 domain-containing protein [Paludibacteraceae bacterium]
MGLLDSLLNAFKQGGGSVLDTVANQAKSAVNRTVTTKTGEIINKAATKATQPKKPAAQQPAAKPEAAAAPTASAGKIYMIKERGKESGPYSKAEIEAMAQSGRINADSPIKKSGMDYWATAYELEEFNALFD